MEASKLKKESFRAWLSQESSVAADRFREAQKAAASVVHSKHSDVGGVWARGGLEQYLWSGRLRWWFPSLGDRRVCSNFSHRSASLGKFTLGCWKESLNKNNVDSIMDVEQRTSFGRDMRVRLTNLHMFQNGSLTV